MSSEANIEGDVFAKRQARREELLLAALAASSQRAGEAERELARIKGAASYRALRSATSVIDGLAPAKTRRGKLLATLVSVARPDGGSPSLRRPQDWLLPALRDGLKDPVPVPPERLVFPRCEAPRASIIIPAYNKSAYTLACLDSVLVNTHSVPYEVIVVDDASTDDTSALLERVENIQIVAQPTNRGFLRAANAGAAAASGRFLVFLNNDTRVREGWLEHLLSPFNDDTVGIVGAKLIYPDGRLQEAGVIVWSDGTGWQYGHFQDPDSPAYNFVREVDYCSGACLAVRSDLWAQTGGFDERYVPAYYEDTDLAFAVRALGYRVIYQHAAEVVHYEGLSHGTDPERGLKRFEAVNRQKFAQKWQGVLADQHYAPGSDPTFARSRDVKARVLVCDNYVPTYDRDAGSERRFTMLRIMAELGYAVTFLPANSVPIQPYTRELQQLGVEVLHGPEKPDAHLARLGPYVDVVLIARPDVGIEYLPKLRAAAPQARFVYDTVDIHYLREERRAALTGDKSLSRQAANTKKVELSLARQCDAVIALTEPDRAALLREAPDLSVFLLPTIHSTRTVTVSFAERSDLLFIGHYQHAPNEDAAVYLVRELLPALQNSIPGVKLYLLGNNPTTRVSELAGPDVIVTGWVKDVDLFFQNTRLFLAPLRFGSGMKGKIGQSLSYGLPVVTTPTGAEGMGLEHGCDVLISESSDELVASVVRLYEDEQLWQQLSRNGLQRVEENWSPGVVRKTISELMDKLLA